MGGSGNVLKLGSLSAGPQTLFILFYNYYSLVVKRPDVLTGGLRFESP